MRVIELRVNCLAFAASMGEMRGWLDRNRFSEVGFQTATEGSEILIRLEFPTEQMSSAFQRQFGERANLPTRRTG